MRALILGLSLTGCMLSPEHIDWKKIEEGRREYRTHALIAELADTKGQFPSSTYQEWYKDSDDSQLSAPIVPPQENFWQHRRLEFIKDDERITISVFRINPESPISPPGLRDELRAYENIYISVTDTQTLYEQIYIDTGLDGVCDTWYGEQGESWFKDQDPDDPKIQQDFANLTERLLRTIRAP